MSYRRRWVWMVASVALTAGTAAAQIQFVDVSGTSGILPYTTAWGFGASVAAADIDDDGDVDFFIPTAGGVPNQLYRNKGDGTFEEVAAAFGLDSLDSTRVALWLDYDADGLLDLFTAADCYEADPACPDTATLRLYRQVAADQFQDVTAAAGLGDDLIDGTAAHRGGMAAGDLNGDGYLELTVSLWGGEKRLFLNNGDGTFSDISIASGLGGATWDHHQPMMYDFDGDGRLDIYYAIDFLDNQLWMNQDGYSFVDEAAASNSHNAMNDMGVTLGDYDHDGDFDIYVTNITTTSTFHNILLRNDSTMAALAFAEVAKDTGVDQGYWGWGTVFFDADNDTWLDIGATNGYFAGFWASDPSRFFVNQGGDPVTFAEVSTAVGFDDTLWGTSLVSLDYDRDGFLDMVQACNGSGLTPGQLRLLQNQPDMTAAGNGYLAIRPRMTGPNRRAIGAVVRLQVGALEQLRLISAGNSYLGQEPSEAFFGLGSGVTTVDTVTIEWPDGSADTVLTDVAANQVLTVTADTDTDGDALVDAADPDDDDDGVPDVDDCFPTNAQFWALPGGIGDLALSHAGTTTTLTWSGPASPGGSFAAYDVLVSDQAADFDAGASCLESWDPADTSAVHQIDPPVGELRYFLVVARNSCGRGPAGSGAGGTPRAIAGCP